MSLMLPCERKSVEPMAAVTAPVIHLHCLTLLKNRSTRLRAWYK